MAARVVALVFCVMSVLQGLAAGNFITELVILGDSLSDDGALFKLTNGVLPPSNQYPSRTHSYSNGVAWHHRVAALGIKVTSRAVAWATGEGNGEQMRHPACRPLLVYALVPVHSL